MSTNFNMNPDQLLALGPASCQDFIRRFFPGRFQWLRLAEGAETKASAELMNRGATDVALNWIRVAVDLFEAMADYSAKSLPEPSERLISAALGLRALALKNWGIDPADPVRDPAGLELRFHSNLHATPDEVASSARPVSSDVRRALEFVRSLQPLAGTSLMERELPELHKYCVAAEAHKNSRRA